MILVMLSSLKILDNYVDRYTSDALKNAAITYATARGINALVSVLQTTTVETSVVFVSGSASIGEILDPVNDLIERFSSVMTVVMGSLAAQKLLLLVSSHMVFQLLIAVLGVISILILYLCSQKQFQYVLKLFLIVVFIRFSLGVAVAMNSMVDTAFLIGETEKYQEEMIVFKKDMEKQGENFDKDKGLVQRIEIIVESSVKNFMNLIAVYLLKTIVFPLAFFYLFIAMIKGLWRSNSLFKR